jgi:hypothetical protein
VKTVAVLVAYGKKESITRHSPRVCMNAGGAEGMRRALKAQVAGRRYFETLSRTDRFGKFTLHLTPHVV